jgi:hypothetical protein
MVLSMLRTHDDQVHVVFVKVPSNFGKSALTAEPVVDDNKDGTYNVRFTARELPRHSRSLIPFLRCFLFGPVAVLRSLHGAWNRMDRTQRK